MKSFWSTKLMSRRDPNDTEVNKSVKQIEREVESLNTDIEDLQKQIRIQTKVCEDFDRQLSEEIKENEAIDRQNIEMKRQENLLIEEIDRKTKHLESLNKTATNLHQTIDSLNYEFKRKSEEYENQIKEFTEIIDHYKRQLELRGQAYQSLNQTIKCSSPDLGPIYQELELKKNEYNALESELASLEDQIKQLRSENLIPAEEVEKYADPIAVITQLAEIKLNSNKLEEIIKMEINRRQNLDINANQSNNELSVKTENLSVEESSQPLMETNSQMDFTPNVVTNIIHTNVTSVGFPMFSAQSPEPNFISFGAQTNPQNVDISESTQSTPFGTQSTPLSPFGNTSAPNHSIFGFFGNRTATEETNTGFGFQNLFGNQLNADPLSPNRSEDSFHFFK